ncbi:flagellin [Vibrio sp. SM6]|uniref:Flagellin n=1 Tax=Vibrio agarilyticus TaxID=2726741 RepID=A0A7X8YHV1_9VIBR|nr:flagellin [Vibrio agarilyticus]NLS13960.1 flagellin [Vibrio agarilyticus]
MTVNVRTNVSALNTQRHLDKSATILHASTIQLASGNKINSAKDDAAGLQIANRLHVHNRGIDVAVRNANDGISIAQIAEGALSETSEILQQIRELSLQSANGANSDDDRSALQEEVKTLNDELNRIANSTRFAGNPLLNGQFASKSFQIGTNSGEATRLHLKDMRSQNLLMGGTVNIPISSGKDEDWTLAADSVMAVKRHHPSDATRDFAISFDLKAGDDIEEIATRINGQQSMMTAFVDEHRRLNLFFAHDNEPGSRLEASGDFFTENGPYKLQMKGVNDLDISTVGGAQLGIAMADAALKYVDSHRAELGSFQNRLTHAINNLGHIDENVQTSKSQIRDADIAKSAAMHTKAQIIQQSATSIFTQAKQTPTSAIGLLK